MQQVTTRTLILRLIKLVYDLLSVIRFIESEDRRYLTNKSISQISELQDIYFIVNSPDDRCAILKNMQNTYGDINALIDDTVGVLSKILSENFIQADISGRSKSPYSIWMKMKRKDLKFSDIDDAVGFRIIVSNVDECYRTVEIICRHYQIIENRYRDFIASPKSNAYQSIHIALTNAKEQHLEIQIRTRRMHYAAESGRAAHWQYKQDLEFIHYL